MRRAVYESGTMHSLFRYIEDNLAVDLDTGLLSSVGYASHAKLYRSFYALTGHSVKEYIRKRRLSNALAHMKMSDMGLADIAFQCGYSSHQALCRAVRQTLGMTPSEYKCGDTYYFFPPFSGEHLQPVTVSNDTIPETLRIRFFDSRLANIESKAVNTFLRVFPDYNGRIFGRNGKRDGNQFCYELYLTDTDRTYDTPTPYGFSIVEKFSSFTATFAASTIPNDEAKINAAWDYLYSEWLQGSMFEYTDEPYYEEYLLRNGKPYRLKLFLPIQKRNEDTRISLIGNPGLHFIVARAQGCNAEKTASQAVIDHFTAYYPELIKTSNELYQHKGANSYTCGIRVNSELRVMADERVRSIATDQSNYLVLESSVMGDYDRYADVLFSFSRDNGMNADVKGIFAVYDAKESFDNLKIRMYCPVRIDTK